MLSLWLDSGTGYAWASHAKMGGVGGWVGRWVGGGLECFLFAFPFPFMLFDFTGVLSEPLVAIFGVYAKMLHIGGVERSTSRNHLQ